VLAQVCNFGSLSNEDLHPVFAATGVGNVWGVGRRIGAKLNESGVRTVLDLVRCDATYIRKQFSVVLEKTVLELRGVSCLAMTDIDDAGPAKQQILVSRSFGKAITEVSGIVEAVSEFASRAAEKLRLQEGAAGAVSVFFTTSPFRQSDRQHSVTVTVTVPLVRPTADSRMLVGSAVDAVHRHFRPGFNYAKAGVTLVDLQPASQQQGELDLFSPGEVAPQVQPQPRVPPRDRAALMEAMDGLNRRFGRDSVRIGSASLVSNGDEVRSWSTKQQRRSHRYTTRWDEMPVVRT
jgi:DNA polymerase V